MVSYKAITKLYAKKEEPNRFFIPGIKLYQSLSGCFENKHPNKSLR